MKNKYKIMISSDLSYEKLVSEIYYDDELIAQIIQEKGLEQPEVKFFGSEVLFDLKEFREVCNDPS